MIGYRNRDAFDLALLKGAVIEIERPADDVLHTIGYFAGIIYPPHPWADPPSLCVVHGPLCR